MYRLFEKKYFCILFIFLVSFIPRAVCASLMYPVNTPVDEVSTLSMASYLAGYDWSDVVSNAGFYYGFGYAIIFTPLFKITSNPFVIYKIILITAAFIFAMIAPVCYHLLDKYLNVSNKPFKIIVSIICSYYTCGQLGPYAINETPLYLLIWLITLNLFKLVITDNQKERILYTVTLAAMTAYSVTIHERAIVLAIVAVVWIIYCAVIYKKMYVNLWVYVLTFAVLYIVARMSINQVQDIMWRSDSENLYNSSINIGSSKLEMFKKPGAWKAAYLIIIGLINTVVIYTGGGIVLAVIPLILHFIKFHKIDNEVEDIQINSVVIFFGLAAILGGGGVAVLWNGGVQTAIKIGYGTNIYGLKAITYMRYYGCFLAPCLMSGLYLVYRNRSELKNYIKISVVVVTMLQVIWFHSIVPYIYNSSAAHYRFMPYAFADYSVQDTKWLYILGSVWLIAIVVICLYICKKRPAFALIPICIFLIYQTVEFYGAMIKVGRERYEACNAGYEAVKKLRDSEVEIDNICVLSNPELYQFLLNREKITVTIPENVNQNNVVLADSYNDMLIDMGYSCYQLDEDEYMYFSEGLAYYVNNICSK